MYCENCGKEIKDGAKFCIHCGAKVDYDFLDEEPEDAVDEPVEEKDEEPVEGAVDETVEEPVEDAVDETVEEKAEEPVEDAVDESVDEDAETDQEDEPAEESEPEQSEPEESDEPEQDQEVEPPEEAEQPAEPEPEPETPAEPEPVEKPEAIETAASAAATASAASAVSKAEDIRDNEPAQDMAAMDYLDEDDEEEEKKTHKALIVIAIIALLVAAAIAAYLIVGAINKDRDQNNDQEATQATEEQTEQTEPTTEEESGIPADAAEYNGHYYLVVDEPMSWTDAREACEEKNGHLATITDQGEQDFIVSLIEKNGEKKNYWLGATDYSNEGDWQWITGEAWGYANWKGNQPDNRDNEDVDHDQDYLQICCGSTEADRYMKWYDMANSGKSIGYEDYPNYKDTQYTGYICEWDSEQ